MIRRVQPVHPELVAAKIEKMVNFELPQLFDECAENPRLIRALWFLEYVSKSDHYAGGLTKFAEDLSASAAEQIGTPTMVECAAADRFTIQQVISILAELDPDDRFELLGENTWIFEEGVMPNTHSTGAELRAERVVSHRFGRSEDELESWIGSRAEFYAELIRTVTPALVRELCFSRVREQLAPYLKALCEQPDVSFFPVSEGHGAPRYFATFAAALFTHMDRRSKEIAESIADTEVTREVRRWTHKARTMSEPVLFSGNSRSGKSETIEKICAADPGNFRLVETPQGNALSDLLRAVATSLGIEVSAENRTRNLRERIDYVLRFSQLTLCFDEMQMCIPSTYSKTTAPDRLNWIRRAIMDKRLSVVFVCTVQNYEKDCDQFFGLRVLEKFCKKTGYAIEQFKERIIEEIRLPTELNQEDVAAVSRVHLAGLSEDLQAMVVGTVSAVHRNFVSDIPKIAKLAKDNAREHGRRTVLTDDIEFAIGRVLGPKKAPEKKKGNDIATTMQSGRKTTSPALKAPRIPPADFTESRRGMQPLTVET